MANPEIIINQSNILKASRNKTGDLTNSYSPFQNLTSESTELLGDFTTEKLNFDLEHPVDIITQDNYDGSVNLILNDGKNTPKLINSKFSIQNDSKFLIPDHYGYKDTNISITGLPYTPSYAAFGGGIAYNVYTPANQIFEGWIVDTTGTISARTQTENKTNAGNLSIGSSVGYTDGSTTMTVAGTICYMISQEVQT